MSRDSSAKPLVSAGFIKFIKDKRNLLLLVLAAVGFIVLFASAIGRDSGKDTDEGMPDGLAKYKSTLESELSQLCSRVSGAGRCVVTVSFSEGERLEYKGSTLVGRKPPTVEGVTVLASGGGSDSVRREISELISALYGIGHNRICVLKLSS